MIRVVFVVMEVVLVRDSGGRGGGGKGGIRDGGGFVG